MPNRDLSQAEFLQISGRAGRAQYDIFGNVIIIGDESYEDDFIKDYLILQPENIESNIKINYNTFANLLDKYGFENLRDVLDRSFYSFTHKEDKFDCLNEYLLSISNVLKHYNYMNKDNKLTEIGKLLKIINADNELFIVELLLSGVLNDLNLEQLVYILSSILTGDKNYGNINVVSKTLNMKEPLTKVRQILLELKNIEGLNNIENNLEINTVFSELVVCWLRGCSWHDLQKKGLPENFEGDFYRLIKRTTDILKKLNKVNSDFISSKLKENIEVCLMCLDRDIINEL